MKTKFPLPAKIEKRLMPAVESTYRDVFDAKAGERIVIVSNPIKDLIYISQALFNGAVERGLLPTLIFQTPRTEIKFAEPAVLAALRTHPEIMVSMSRDSLGKDPEALKNPYQVGDKKIDHVFVYHMHAGIGRAFWAGHIDVDIFSETVPIDYPSMWELGKRMKAKMDGADWIRIETEAGTDLMLGLKGREILLDDGDYRSPGKGGNLPAGEVYFSPTIGTANGKAVIDGSIVLAEGEMVIKEPVIFTFKDGFCVDIEGGKEAELFLKTLAKAEENTKEMIKNGTIPPEFAEIYLKNIRHAGELGIGINPAAKIVGKMLEDEKVLGTCHIALGSNYDRDANAISHLDAIMLYPKISAIFPDKTGKLIIDFTPFKGKTISLENVLKLL